MMNNFEKAISDAIKQYLHDEGIVYAPQNDTLLSAFTAYMNILDKWIEPQKRKVHISTDLNGRLNGTDYDKKEIVDLFQQRFENGDDINGHQSRGIYKSEKHDKLLIMWGISHFHLNATTANTDALMRLNRSDDLLFAIVTDTDAYFIDIESHNRPKVWSMFRLLEIIQTNWEWLLLKNDDIVSVNEAVKDDAQLDALFKANVNPFIHEINGNFYSCGIRAQTMAGTSVTNQLLLNQLHRCLKSIIPKPPKNPTNIRCVLKHSKRHFCTLYWNEGENEVSYEIKERN